MTQAEEICWESQPAIEKKAGQGRSGRHVTCNLTSLGPSPSHTPPPHPHLRSREQPAADGKRCGPWLQSHCTIDQLRSRLLPRPPRSRDACRVTRPGWGWGWGLAWWLPVCTLSSAPPGAAALGSCTVRTLGDTPPCVQKVPPRQSAPLFVLPSDSPARIVQPE